MRIAITPHARGRMRSYLITTKMVFAAINAPDNILQGYGIRKIYQKRLNGHVLRVITEQHNNIITVITTYKARSVRYEI